MCVNISGESLMCHSGDFGWPKEWLDMEFLFHIIGNTERYTVL